MAVYNNPYLNSFQQPMYQQPQQSFMPQQPQQGFMPQQPVIDWDAVTRACQTLMSAAANAPGGGEYATKADLEKLKQEILEGVKANA